MIEVEIRANIKDIDSVRKRVLELGANHINTENQIDKIFGRAEDLDEEHKIIEGHFSARIRQKGDKKFVQFKEIKRDGIGLELSLPIDSIQDGVKFLEKLDYTEAFTVSKTRELYKLDNSEICLDKVAELGNFIEIESGSDDDDKERLIQECKNLLSKIDPDANVEPKKYGDLMQELINNRRGI
jgi:adenylate cyclase class 2